MEKFRFFGKFFLNAAYAVLFSQALILFLIMVVPLREPTAKFAFTTLLMFLLLVFRFLREGCGENTAERASLREFIFGAMPTWAFFGTLQTIVVFVFNKQVSGNGVFSLALIISGNLSANALRVGEMPENIAPAFALSLLANAVLYTAFAFIGYRLGILRRDTERKNTLSGNNTEFLFYKKLPFFACFIPLWNIVTLFPWLLSYLILPEKKLSRFFGKIAQMFAALLLVRGLRVLFYIICPVKWAYGIFYFLTLYALCVICALIAFRDAEKQ